MKLNIKEIDFKQFFIEHGEKIGLAVAGGLTVLLLLLTILGFLSADSPDAKKTAMNKEHARITSSFTFTSLNTRSRMASRRLRMVASVTGTIICCRGWRTRCPSFLRMLSTSEVSFWASAVRASSSASMSASLCFGQLLRWTLLPVRSR